MHFGVLSHFKGRKEETRFKALFIKTVCGPGRRLARQIKGTEVRHRGTVPWTAEVEDKGKED